MIKHAWPLAVLAAAWLVASCGEVDSCKELQELGCLNSAPLPSGGCLFDLVRRGDVCVKPGSPEDLCGQCAQDQLCIPEENRCSNSFCEVPSPLPGSVSPPEAIFCEAFVDPAKPTENPMLSFDEVCRRRCRLECQRLEQFCPGYKCPSGTCDKPELLAECKQDCPNTSLGQMDLACLTRSCNNQRFTGCTSTLACPNGATPSCATITCTNDCMYQGQGLAGDGICDDGDVYSSQGARCAWGTDCADCGPRTGTQPPAGVYGSVCAFGANCQGGTGKPSTATAWCVASEKQSGISRCLPDCSRGQECDPGFACREALFDLGNGTKEPVVEDTVRSSACMPTLCF